MWPKSSSSRRPFPSRSPFRTAGLSQRVESSIIQAAARFGWRAVRRAPSTNSALDARQLTHGQDRWRGRRVQPLVHSKLHPVPMKPPLIVSRSLNRCEGVALAFRSAFRHELTRRRVRVRRGRRAGDAATLAGCIPDASGCAMSDAGGLPFMSSRVFRSSWPDAIAALEWTWVSLDLYSR